MSRSTQPTRGFTLVEMLVVMTIIAILAGMVMAALGGAAESAKVQRAQQQIAKIDQLINDKWNSYRYRQVPVRIPTGTQPAVAAKRRLDALRELMRMEMPDRLTDIYGPFSEPVTLPSRPSLSRAYYRKVTAAAAANSSYHQAECLYLILSEMQDGDRSALNFFMSSEIGDIDGDGMNEILDPWGQPILWLRWAPGYSRYTNAELDPTNQLASPWPQLENAVVTLQVQSGNVAPDPFDPLKIDPRWSDSTAGTLRPFLLRPLIFSAGPDKVYDIYTENAANEIRKSQTVPPNDPYSFIVDTGVNRWLGEPIDYDGDGLNHADNITNHGLELLAE